MIDKKSDNDPLSRTTGAHLPPTYPPKLQEPAGVRVTPPPPPKSGRGLASLALLLALGALGASGYLWYLWQQDATTQTNRTNAAIKQAATQFAPEIQNLKNQLQQILASNESQQIKGQLLGLTGDVQPLKNAMELQKGENELLKNEMKLLRESYDAQKADFQKQKQVLEAQLQEQLSHAAKLDEQLKNARLTDANFANDLNALRILAAKGGDINAFPLTEVDYLLRLADSKLKLERNIPAALLALETAQERLKAVDEPALAPIQTQIDETLGSLRGVKLPDFSALAHKLAEIQQRVSALPIKIDSSVPDARNWTKPATDPKLSDDATRSWLDRVGEAVWKQFKDIVVIRRVRSDAPPLVAMEEEFFLRQNLVLELESMRMSLLRGDAQSYQDSQALIESWLKTYFNTQDPGVAAFQSQIAALKEVQFNTYIPDLSGLTKAFQEAIARRQPIRAVRKASEPVVEPPAAGGGR
ncbi:MAG: uroporphyrinogen-III C-methyltransferase [Candidatus Competibacter sp.]|nr:uroporphyrinogen-III C-methyltransferase [Candidatus Competibacter sp.]